MIVGILLTPGTQRNAAAMRSTKNEGSLRSARLESCVGKHGASEASAEKEYLSRPVNSRESGATCV